MTLITNSYNLAKFFPELDLIIGMRHKNTNILENTGLFLIVKIKNNNLFYTSFIYNDNNFISCYNLEQDLINKLNQMYNTNQWTFTNYFDISSVCYGLDVNKKIPFWKEQ